MCGNYSTCVRLHSSTESYLFCGRNVCSVFIHTHSRSFCGRSLCLILIHTQSHTVSMVQTCDCHNDWATTLRQYPSWAYICLITSDDCQIMFIIVCFILFSDTRKGGLSARSSNYAKPQAEWYVICVLEKAVLNCKLNHVLFVCLNLLLANKRNLATNVLVVSIFG